MIFEVRTTHGAEAMASHKQAFRALDAANDEDLTPVLRKTMVSLVRMEGADLTARQLGIFLTVYLEKGPHTVRGLAALFDVCKPAVSRALDRLGECDLARRKADPRDRRSVLVQRTDRGWAFLAEVRRAMGEAAECAERPKVSPVDLGAWPKAIATHRTGFGHGCAANSA
jgi:DNA-binding MarR family transcriptional regulator